MPRARPRPPREGNHRGLPAPPRRRYPRIAGPSGPLGRCAVEVAVVALPGGARIVGDARHLADPTGGSGFAWTQRLGQDGAHYLGDAAAFTLRRRAQSI